MIADSLHSLIGAVKNARRDFIIHSHSGLVLARIVRRLASDHHVVWVTLQTARSSDADELRLLQSRDILSPTGKYCVGFDESRGTKFLNCFT